jgi:hypothetical protein
MSDVFCCDGEGAYFDSAKATHRWCEHLENRVTVVSMSSTNLSISGYLDAKVYEQVTASMRQL